MVKFLKVLRATLDDILREPGTSLRISVPMMAGFVAVMLPAWFLSAVLSASGAGATVETVDPMVFPELPPGAGLFLAATAAGFLLLLAGWLWTAVAWHRFVVLNERPRGWLPRFRGDLILGYAGRGILTLLMMLLVTIPIAGLVGFAEADSSGNVSIPFLGLPEPLTARNVVLAIIAGALWNGMFLRVATMMPARAVDAGFGVSVALDRTRGAFFSFYVPLGVSLAVFYALLDFVWSFAPMQELVSLAAEWMKTMVEIGVLTRVYMEPPVAGPPGSGVAVQDSAGQAGGTA